MSVTENGVECLGLKDMIRARRVRRESLPRVPLVVVRYAAFGDALLSSPLLDIMCGVSFSYSVRDPIDRLGGGEGSVCSYLGVYSS